jgi:hypothetical protein
VVTATECVEPTDVESRPSSRPSTASRSTTSPWRSRPPTSSTTLRETRAVSPSASSCWTRRGSSATRLRSGLPSSSSVSSPRGRMFPSTPSPEDGRCGESQRRLQRSEHCTDALLVPQSRPLPCHVDEGRPPPPRRAYEPFGHQVRRVAPRMYVHHSSLRASLY